MKEVQQFMNQFLHDAVSCGLGEWLVNPNRNIYANAEHTEMICNLKKDYDFSIEFGTYRHTFIFDDYDWVLKIPRKIGKHNYNDCEIEVLVYKLAEKYGVNHFFAPAAKLVSFNCSLGEIPIYVMKKVFVDEERVSEHFYSLYDGDSEDEDDIDDWYYNNFDEINATMQAFVDYYGGVEADNLRKFLNNIHINDIHSGNVGYDEDDNLIIIDYAGYSNEDYWDEEHENKIQNILAELEKERKESVF